MVPFFGLGAAGGYADFFALTLIGATGDILFPEKDFTSPPICADRIGGIGCHDHTARLVVCTSDREEQQ